LFILSSTKLEIRAEQFLPGSKEVGEEMEEVGGRGGEMTQTLYAHMNKQKTQTIHYCKREIICI
jgi:hypothetical protein